MCLILLTWDRHPRYRLVAAANRDEFHARPTRPARYWEDAPGVLAGRDGIHGGTWMGIDRRRRVSAVTNIREPSLKHPKARSRGLLVSDYLRGDEDPARYLERVRADIPRYDPFNLLAGDDNGLYFLSSLDAAVQALDPGIYGVSNGPLDCPWPKLTRGKACLEALIEADRVETGALLDILGDAGTAPDELLPDTGVGIEMERVLSAAFIRTATYGTRSSTALLLEREGGVSWVERSYDPAGRITGTVSEGF